MKKIFISIAIIITLIAIIVIVDRKEFSRHDDVQTVQSENPTFNEKPLISVPETKTVAKVKPIETKQTETKTAAEAESKNKSAPAAIPVLTPEEAGKANADAIKSYNSRKVQKTLKKGILVIIFILCVAVLIFTNHPQKWNHIHPLPVFDFVGWGIISFVIMYCAILIFQIERPGYEFLTSLQPILTSSSLHLPLATFLLLVIIYVKKIFPYLLKCNIWAFFVIELLFCLLVGIFVINHFSIELVSDFQTLSINAEKWQTLPSKTIERYLSRPELGGAFARRCYFSYYLLYKLFGCKYIIIEFSQLFMHLALGINVYFLAKQCVIQEKIARLSMILYYFMPVQYLYLTMPSLDLWGGMLLCFNANLIVYLFKKSPQLYFYKHVTSINSCHNSTIESESAFQKTQRYILSFINRIPWLFPMLVSILLGITLFWMEMVRNLQLILCIPLFLFLSAVVVRRILSGKMKLFSRTMFFICMLCLFVPFLSNKAIQKICNVTPYGSDGIPVATVLFNSPDEVREVIRFGDFHWTTPERRKDFALDAATSYWHLYPKNYARYFGTKQSYFSDLFKPTFIATTENIQKYPQEFEIYYFLVMFAKAIFMPLLLLGALCVLFLKRWNSLAYVPIVLFFFFFFLMPTVGECQERYTSLYYAPMCVCAACSSLLIKSKRLHFIKKINLRTRFVNSLLWGISCIIIFLFAITALFSSSHFLKKHLWINFHKNLCQISSGDSPAAYKEYTDRNYLLSNVFYPAVPNVIPEKTYVEWTIPEQTTEGLEYMLYGFLIAPLKDNADFVVKINGISVWDNSAFAKSGSSYSNDKVKINDEKIIFLDNLKFIAERKNTLRVEIIPHKNNGIDFALCAWGMVPSK